MKEIEWEESPMADCIVCTSITAEEIYRREKQERSLSSRIIDFIINLFYEERL